MLKYCAILFSVFSIGINAQNDSSRYKTTAFQADLSSPLDIQGGIIEQSDLQKFVTDDLLLNSNLQGYEKTNGFFVRGSLFEGMAGGKIFFKKRKSNHLRREFFIGFRVGQNILSGVNYSKTTEDTLTSFTDPQTGKTKFVLKRHVSSYNFVILSDVIYIPLGLNFTTNTARLFWFSAGVELTPFLLFNNELSAHSSETIFQTIVEAGKTPDYFSNGTNVESGNLNSAHKMKGVGTGIYVGTPLCLYFHPFRKATNGLQRFNLMAGIMPVGIYTTNRFSGASFGATANGSIGLKYSL